jgi:hypothetical protein
MLLLQEAAFNLVSKCPHQFLNLHKEGPTTFPLYIEELSILLSV